MVLKLACQPYYRWRNALDRNAEVVQAYRINALHGDPTLLKQQQWRTLQDQRLAIVLWIELKYHLQRAQETLGGFTP